MRRVFSKYPNPPGSPHSLRWKHVLMRPSSDYPFAIVAQDPLRAVDETWSLESPRGAVYSTVRSGRSNEI